MALELAGLLVANVAYAVVGLAAFAAAGWLRSSDPSTWPRAGAAYLFGLVLVVVPASYLALASVPVGASAAGTGVVVVAFAVWRRGLPRPWPRPRLRAPTVAGWCSLAIAGVALVLLAYSARTFVTRPLVDNDAWAVWTVRGRLLYENVAAAPAVLRGGQYGPTPYPIGLPTLEALGFGAMGRYDATLINAQFLFLLTGFGAALWSILHRRANPIAIALTIAAITATPELLYQLLTQYADIPLGLFVGLAIAAATAWLTSDHDDRWLPACVVAFLTMAGLTKSEGLMFVVAACAALVVARLGPGWRDRVRATGIVVGSVVALLAPWRIYCSIHHLSTSDYDLANVIDVGYLRAHSDRVGPIVRELWAQLHGTHTWGYLLAAIGAGVVTGLVWRRYRETAFVALWLVLGFLGLVLVYWVSTLPTTFNLTNSSFRTIVSLVVGGTAVLPLLIAPARRSDEPRTASRSTGGSRPT